MNNVPPSAINLRIAHETDLPSIVEIYNQAVPTRRSTANTTPVTVEQRQTWFRDHEPTSHPIFVAEIDGKVVGWCSISVYRPGRRALRFTAELSYYVDSRVHRRGVASALVESAVRACPMLGIKNLVAVVIDRNQASQKLLEKLGFERWGYLPRVLDFDGQEFGEFYYGKRVSG